MTTVIGLVRKLLEMPLDAEVRKSSGDGVRKVTDEVLTVRTSSDKKCVFLE